LNCVRERKPEQSKQIMIGVVIRAGVEPYQQHELMQMFKETSRPDQLPAACLERRVYEEAHAPTNLLLVEQWSDKAAMNSYLSSDQFRALIGVDSGTIDEVEGRSMLNVADDKKENFYEKSSLGTQRTR
jgi:quinol monooxygenase YgiN